jgi:hypothetical protein
MTELTRRNALIAGAWSVPAVVFAVGTPAAASSYKEITLSVLNLPRVDADGFVTTYIQAHVAGDNTRTASNVFVIYTAATNSPYLKYLGFHNAEEDGSVFLGDASTTPGDFILYPTNPMLFGAQTIIEWQVTDVTKLPIDFTMTMVADGFDPWVTTVRIYPKK